MDERIACHRRGKQRKGQPMRRLQGGQLLAAALAFAILAPLPSHAQKVTLSEEAVKARPDMSVAKRQLTMASDLGRRTLQSFRAAQTDSSISVDENFVQPARNTYALIRAARESMDLKKQYMKYPDPVFDLAYKRVAEAWNLSRTPVDKYTWSMERDAYLSISVRDVDRALQLVQQALIILP
jgi:hypothetical protein